MTCVASMLLALTAQVHAKNAVGFKCMMFFAFTARVNADWTGNMKSYKDASCTVVDGTKSWEVKRQGNFECMKESQSWNPPLAFYKVTPGMYGACEGGSAVSERTSGCTDATCSTCTGSTEKQTRTSAQVDQERAMWSGKCIQHPKASDTWVVQTVDSGAYPANPCNSGTLNKSQRVSNRLHEVVALAALLSTVFALQQRE